MNLEERRLPGKLQGRIEHQSELREEHRPRPAGERILCGSRLFCLTTRSISAIMAKNTAMPSLSHVLPCFYVWSVIFVSLLFGTKMAWVKFNNAGKEFKISPVLAIIPTVYCNSLESSIAISAKAGIESAQETWGRTTCTSGIFRDTYHGGVLQGPLENKRDEKICFIFSSHCYIRIYKNRQVDQRFF